MRITQGRHQGVRSHSGWRLLDGTGRRTSDYFVPFGVEYRKPPSVHVGITGFDILFGQNHRLIADVVQVRRDGFILRYSTWADTRVYAARVNWLAIGATARSRVDMAGVSEENDEEGFDEYSPVDDQAE
ncbi:MAG: H-type lectin domain-containing protein [Bacteroidota bacterium]